MSELFDLFSDLAPAEPATEPTPETPMTDAQRADIRQLFGELGITTADEQFELVHVLIGVRLSSVGDLKMKAAALLIPRLRQRVVSKDRVSTGDSWADREEDTWIDSL